MVTKELYKPENGGRVGSRKVLIMLLCGDQTQVRVSQIPISIIFLFVDNYLFTLLATKIIFKIGQFFADRGKTVIGTKQFVAA